VESLLALGGGGDRFRFAAGERAGLHPGQTALIEREGETVGVLGALHPVLQKELGFDQPVMLAEIDLDILRSGQIPAYHRVSRYPGVRRDIAVVVDASLPVDTLLETARSAAGSYMTHLTLFDVYQGKGIDTARKSVALGLTFQESSRTLDDQEVNRILQQVIDSLREKHDAQLRG